MLTCLYSVAGQLYLEKDTLKFVKGIRESVIIVSSWCACDRFLSLAVYMQTLSHVE